MRAWQAILHHAARPLAGMLLVLALAMLACGLVGWLHQGSRGLPALVVAAGTTALAGLLLRRLAPEAGSRELGRREALVVVGLAWASGGVFGGLPYVLGAGLTPVDALFETISGFTTTGASILPRIGGTLSAPLHLWRAATHWLGGLGIVVIFVALFPALGVGGRHLVRMEAPTSSHGAPLTPRIQDTARILLQVYLVLTATLFLLLTVTGMGWFDALVHALSTMGTGGFSNRDGSVGAFDAPLAEVVLVVFMLLAGTNFALFHLALRRGPRVLWRSPELRTYLSLFAVASTLVAASLLTTGGHPPLRAARDAAFQVASILTTTGFATADYESWPALAQVVLIALFFVGGCSGSTAGGVKVVRLLVLARTAAQEVARTYRPGLVAVVRLGRRVVAEDAVREALLVALLFCLTALGGGVLVALLDDAGPATALSASLACVSNVGPGFGAVGPTGHFGGFSPAAKLVLVGEMLLGRLEFLVLLALFSPRFWRP